MSKQEDEILADFRAFIDRLASEEHQKKLRKLTEEERSELAKAFASGLKALSDGSLFGADEDEA